MRSVVRFVRLDTGYGPGSKHHGMERCSVSYRQRFNRAAASRRSGFPLIASARGQLMVDSQS